jgi:hypothetical protein
VEYYLNVFQSGRVLDCECNSGGTVSFCGAKCQYLRYRRVRACSILICEETVRAVAIMLRKRLVSAKLQKSKNISELRRVYCTIPSIFTESYASTETLARMCKLMFIFNPKIISNGKFGYDSYHWKLRRRFQWWSSA